MVLKTFSDAIDTEYICPKCLIEGYRLVGRGLVPLFKSADSFERFCSQCGTHYPENCLSTHGSEGYLTGTIIWDEYAICPACGIRTKVVEGSIGSHCKRISEFSNRGIIMVSGADACPEEVGLLDKVTKRMRVAAEDTEQLIRFLKKYLLIG